MSLRTEFVLFASQDGRTSAHCAVTMASHLSPATSGSAAGLKMVLPASLTAPGHRTPLRAGPATGRFEHLVPNQLWQMDFKGHFPFGGRCHPLTLLDDHSRFFLCLASCADERRETVQLQLVRVFERYGLPERMTMDNGTPWGDTTGVWTALELWLMRQGIRVGHSRPYHPQPQGKLEHFHRSLKAEVLQGKWFADSGELQRAFDHWWTVYNLERPHEVLDMAVPTSWYQPSSRRYSDSVSRRNMTKGCRSGRWI